MMGISHGCYIFVAPVFKFLRVKFLLNFSLICRDNYHLLFLSTRCALDNGLTLATLLVFMYI